MRSLLFAVLIWGWCGVAAAGSLDLGINDNSAEVDFRHTISADTLGGTEFDLKGLYSSKNDVETTIIAGGLAVYGKLTDGLELGVGIKGYGADAETVEVACIAFGGVLRYFPSYLYGFGFYGRLYYAPEVLSWADADHFVDLDLGLEYQLIPRARIFVGYNRARADFEVTGRATIDEGVRGGLSLHF